MTQKISPVVCDGCGADITTRGNSVDYRLSLKTEVPMPWWQLTGDRGGLMTDMMIYPAIDEPHHFCNSLNCVRSWLEKKANAKKSQG